MILRNLWRRMTRSLLTILGIAIGVAAVVALGNMAQSIIQNYGNIVGGSNDLLVMQADAADVAFSSLDETIGEQLQRVPGVENVDPGVFTWIVVEDVPIFLVYGYPPGSVSMDYYRIVEGKPVTGPKQIAIGRRAADSLNVGVDDTIRLQGVPYRVVGIYETGQGIEEMGGVVAFEDAQEIAEKPRKVSLFQVGLRRNTDAEQVIERIRAMNDDLLVTKTSEYVAGGDWAGIYEGFAWSIAAIAVLVGGLGMMNTMQMSVMERTREIGTLRALGWRRRQVLGMIVSEGVVLSLLGGIVGIGFGILLTRLALLVPGVGAFLEGGYSLAVLVQGIVIALVLGLLGSAVPAWRAANLRPVEALRYEAGGAGDAAGTLAHIGSLSFRNLWRQRNRTIIAAAGIGLGVATVVMLSGLTASFIGTLNNLAGSGSPGSITVMQKDVADMSLSALDERMIAPIRAMPEVKSVSPMILGFVSTKQLPFFIVAGIDPNTPAMAHYRLREGRMIQRPNEMLLGTTAADNYDLSVGDTMQIYSNYYKIVGIFETGIAWEDGSGILALKESQRLLNRPRSVSYLFIDVYNPADAEQVRTAIERRFPDVRASLSSEFAQNTNDIQQMEGLIGAIKGLAVIVSGVVVANTMIMAVYERTREIGTLRALGWARSRILRQIVEESVLLCVVAGALGALLGVGFLYLLEYIPGIRLFAAAQWDATMILQAFALALAMGVIGGLYPAWRATLLQPAEALQYE